jgi:signal transduction histidine kinase
MRIDFISLKSRIYWAFILFSLIFVGIAYFIFQSQKKQLSDFQEIQLVSEQKLLHGHIEKMMKETQSYAQNFINTGRVSDYKRVKELLKSIVTIKKEALQKPYDLKVLGILENVKPLLDNYEQYFDLAVNERKVREDLVRNKMNHLEEQMQKELQQLKNISEVTKSKLFIQILLIQKNIIQYTTDLRSLYIKNALEHLQNCSKLISKNAAIDKVVLDIKNLIVSIEQSTQAYLYLVNVVMAAEASELLYQTRYLDKISTIKQRELQTTIISTSKENYETLMMASLIVIVFTLFLSYAISSSITGPLSMLENTFKNLSFGRKIEDIPALSYKDEIGELAKAANVFKRKNEQTEQLLDESKQLTNELEQNKNELKKSNEELEQFVFTVSHDLKSPIVTSMGYIGIIKELVESGDVERVAPMLDKIGRANKRMSLLINDLLELSRVGKIEIEKSEVNMKRLIADIKENFHQKCKELDFDFIVEGELQNVKGNESRIIQVFDNLVSNALKYGESKDSKNIIKIKCNKTEEGILYTVSDEGMGIPEKFYKKVFVIFSRLNQDKEGTGVGLAVVKKIMEYHNGKVWIESPDQKGTKFNLLFPS